ncbi:hypothetical protein [Pseudomonas sp. B392_1p]|uniref:hypothetical protein n=1 Tax=Pseudomonas sp. B392_1p TaxID=3457507 RepID=UPI003FD10AC6
MESFFGAMDDRARPLLGGKMEINLTAIERNFRLFAGPALVTLVPTIILVTFGEVSQTNPYMVGLAAVLRPVFLGLAAIALMGVIWFSWRLWLIYRWEKGDLNGGCNNCAFVVKHRSGRYGNYSECLNCGSKREGWH